MAMIRVAVIGAGQWGPNLFRNFHNKETSAVVWIIDRDATRLKEVHAHFPDVHVATDAKQALCDSSVHAVGELPRRLSNSKLPYGSSPTTPIPKQSGEARRGAEKHSGK